MRDLHGIGIDVAGKNVLCSQKPRRDRQDSRTRADIEHDMMRLDPSLQRFYRDLRRFVSTRAECLPRVDPNRKPIVRAFGIFPTRDDEEIVADWKARVRLLPLFSPIALLDYRSRNRRMGATRP